VAGVGREGGMERVCVSAEMPRLLALLPRMRVSASLLARSDVRVGSATSTHGGRFISRRSSVSMSAPYGTVTCGQK
jgi:hypothetical protein